MPLPEPIRTSFRRYVRLDCQVVREHDFRLVGDLALDLSTRGMLVRARQRVLTGEEVVVAFKPPRSNAWFDAQGVIARVLHGRRPGDYGLSFGVEFVNLSKEDELILFESLRGIAAPDAQRPPRPLARAPESRSLVRAA
ncbi:MAG: PilZ domain-containing protein [Labilithrix sp.]|nr:PilZ domain-containing protein [Labilithrix sp.]MCW5833882.1 PilZ domain-containing protein [Labilithrix sp.]